MKFSLLDYCHGVDWQRLDRFHDRMVFQKRQWVSFIAETQDATPVIAELRDNGTVLGYFTGLTFRRFGIRILGSSFPGWTTPYMGFNLAPSTPHWKALEALETFAFHELDCLHMEVSDRYFSFDDGKRLDFTVTAYDSYETDLTLSEEQLFLNMTSACRRCIRKAEKSGLQIEEARDAYFAEEYYEQLKEVFAKQRLVPTYNLKRVEKLVEHMLPTGCLLLLRARDEHGRCVATGIYPAMNKVAEFWGNASFGWGQHLRPNEALHWYAMRYWKRRGIEIFDWGGLGSYKEKYGPRRVSIPWFRKSRSGFIGALREGARIVFDIRQRILGKIQSIVKENPRPEA